MTDQDDPVQVELLEDLDQVVDQSIEPEAGPAGRAGPGGVGPAVAAEVVGDHPVSGVAQIGQLPVPDVGGKGDPVQEDERRLRTGVLAGVRAGLEDPEGGPVVHHETPLPDAGLEAGRRPSIDVWKAPTGQHASTEAGADDAGRSETETDERPAGGVGHGVDQPPVR
jgi:hypothetical protein